MNTTLPSSVEALVQRVDTIYTLPSVFHRISEAVSDPDNSIDDISEVISNDQSIAFRVLQLANSAFFAFPAKVDTISQAVTLIGIRQIRDLIQGVTVIEAFDGIPVQEIEMRSFWKHSIACGLTAKIMAIMRREPNIERFFVLGLLHDIGRLILFQQEPAVMRDLLLRAHQEKQLLHHLELQTLGFTHADVTTALMQKWQFPKRLSEGVRAHHAFVRSSIFALENASVHVADIMAHTLNAGTSGELFIPHPHPEAWKMMGLEVQSLSLLTKELDRQLDGVLKIMLT